MNTYLRKDCWVLITSFLSKYYSLKLISNSKNRFRKYFHNKFRRRVQIQTYVYVRVRLGNVYAIFCLLKQERTTLLSLRRNEVLILEIFLKSYIINVFKYPLLLFLNLPVKLPKVFFRKTLFCLDCVRSAGKH